MSKRKTPIMAVRITTRRLAATKHFRDFLLAGRPAPKAPEKEEKRLVTLQELEELVRSSEAEKQSQPR